MVRGLIFFVATVVFVTWLPAQDPEVPQSPCDSPLIEKVTIGGLEALRFRDLPFFLRDVYLCRRTPTGKATLSNLEQQWRTQS